MVTATAPQKLVIGWGFRFTVFDDTGESPKDVTTDVAIEFNVLGCIDAQSYERVEVWDPPEKGFRITFHPVPLLSPRAKTPQFEHPVLFSDIVAKPKLVTTGGYVVARISNSVAYSSLTFFNNIYPYVEVQDFVAKHLPQLRKGMGLRSSRKLNFILVLIISKKFCGNGLTLSFAWNGS
mgnify:CR=1 FL=1